MDHKLSMNALVFALIMGAVVCFAAFLLYGAWDNRADGRRQNLRERGVRPFTDSDGEVRASAAETERKDDGE